ncbi:ribonucleotide reductase assembly protein NrdI [Periweissella cryptocerci]|uniref:Ribonucleotide reductase assembly protein NrdI n=1 Tax=Periweissella cryptocerci TaxID=2506420 RepID=A0A4P6YTQ6_9LACO|nr:class Ib ribonucleoside-diphosphate reductase assembly flavoprotein NrdI [Periweissella cryptocerci]QBO36080.1 ribonucleotide reductase assembly protein NrdI [Periweissella cryptocerci]
MQPIRILFNSISGNTRSFINHITEYAKEQNAENAENPLIDSVEISDLTDFADETQDYFVFVPTYLDGGNGVDNGVKELMTNALGEYITYNENGRHVLGVVGSGNRNFNEQYILTARRYAQATGSEVIADYELRGTPKDFARIYAILKKYQTLNA